MDIEGMMGGKGNKCKGKKIRFNKLNRKMLQIMALVYLIALFS